jgi:hypothetical protein
MAALLCVQAGIMRAAIPASCQLLLATLLAAAAAVTPADMAALPMQRQLLAVGKQIRAADRDIAAAGSDGSNLMGRSRALRADRCTGCDPDQCFPASGCASCDVEAGYQPDGAGGCTKGATPSVSTCPQWALSGQEQGASIGAAAACRQQSEPGTRLQARSRLTPAVACC